MSGGAPERPGAYARRLEGTLARLHGRPWILSPRDWALASTWCEREIPAALVVEALERAAERSRRRGGEPPRSLAYVAGAVEEGWSIIREGRISGADPAPAPTPDRVSREPVLRAWERARDRLPRGAELTRLLAELTTRLAAGDDPTILDTALDDALLQSAPAELVTRMRESVERELARFRSRMPRERYEATLRRGLRARLRQALGLPRAAP